MAIEAMAPAVRGVSEPGVAVVVVVVISLLDVIAEVQLGAVTSPVEAAA